jgi:hypothetical protein
MTRAARGSLWVALMTVVAVTACPGFACSQELTGALVGTVKDVQGGAIEHADVRVTSTALIGGSLATITNDKGQLRFPLLPPGSYTLDIQKSGFAPYHEEDIAIGARATLQRTVVLRLAGVAESVVVEGHSSLDARGSGIETRIGSDYLTSIPTRRFSMFDSIRAAPGVSPTSPSSGTVNTVSAFGSGANENLFLIDGTNFTCPCAGVSRAEPSVDVIQEVQIQSIGISAEYGNIQGSVINVVTRQGSDHFRFDTSYFGQLQSLTSQPVKRPVSGTGELTGYERVKYHDATANLGGPVVRDRLWFFTGYQYLRDYDGQPGTDPKYPRAYQQNKIFGKLSWRLTPGLQLMQSFHRESWVNPDRPTFVTPVEATTRPHTTVHAMTFADISHSLSSNTVWTGRVGRFTFHQFAPPTTGNFTISSHFDRVTGITTDASGQFGGATLLRTTAKLMLMHYHPALFGADHELKVGTQFERGEHDQPVIITAGTRYVDNAGQPFQSVSQAPSISAGLFNTVAFFASDGVTIGPRLALNLGVRFDHSSAISQDIDAVDAQGHRTDRTIHGLGQLYTWNVVSPRPESSYGLPRTGGRSCGRATAASIKAC